MAPVVNTKPPPFTTKCEDYLRMVQMIKDGEIDTMLNPKIIYDAHPELFSKYSLTSFRAQLYKYKTANGLMVRTSAPPPDDDEKPNGGGEFSQIEIYFTLNAFFFISLLSSLSSFFVVFFL